MNTVYSAEVLWGPRNSTKKPFLKGNPGDTATEALENLHELSAHVLGKLKERAEVENIWDYGPRDFRGLGSIVLGPTE